MKHHNPGVGRTRSHAARGTRTVGPVVTAAILASATAAPWLASTARAQERPQALAQTSAQAVGDASPRPLPSIDLSAYLGTWFQVAHIPNEFQRQCIADTQATYRRLPDDRIEVRNRCRTASGIDEVVGAAQPRGSRIDGSRLEPASLEVAFAPTWLRWLGAVWGEYDVLALLDDGTISIVGEPSRKYLWVLARSASLTDDQWRRIDEAIRAQGYDAARVVRG